MDGKTQWFSGRWDQELICVLNNTTPCKKATGILAGSRQESRSPPRSRRDLASPGIFPLGSRQEKNPAIDPAGTPTGNLRLYRDPAKNPDYPEIPPGSCQPGYFPAGIPLGKKSRHKSRRDSHRESLSSPGSRHESRLPRDPAGILQTRVFSRRDPVRKEFPLGLLPGIFVFTGISPRK